MRLLLALCALLASTALFAGENPPAAPALPEGLYAEFTTPRGTFICALHAAQAPLTVTSFVGLAEGTLAARDGRPFYTGLKWYRVVPNFVLQSGDPTYTPDKPDDNAGHPYTFPDEFVPRLHHDAAGVLSMANAGPDTNSSEFFVTLRDTTRLNYLHSVFGRVVRGLDVLPRIQANDAFAIRILRVGAAAQSFRADPAAFAALRAQARPSVAGAEPGPTAHFDDPDRLLPAEPPRAKNFNYKLANFERTTGLKICARVLAHSPTPEEDAVPGAYMKALAAKLGTLQRGVLAVYFADEPDWRLWIGDETVAAFLGRTPTPTDLGDGGALHDAKMAFIEAAGRQAEVYTAEAEKFATPEKPVTSSQKIKYAVDAVLDALLLQLESPPAR